MWLKVALFGAFLTSVLGFDSYNKNLGNHGEVILTNYIEMEDIEGARNASFVQPFLNNIQSYSGFFRVNTEFNSNLFFWFFPAEKDKEHAPLVVWLQGGPGTPSLFGLFSENGAYRVDKSGKLSVRDYYWSQIANVIYIDNPVGTGFSFTENDQGYSTNQDDIGSNLVNAISQFYQVFPEYLNNDLYIFGESYGGKYAPSMAYYIHTNYDKRIKLKGVGIGNGLTDPINMMVYDEYLYQIGLIDQNGKERFERAQNDLLTATRNGDYASAGKLFNKVLYLFMNETGFHLHFNLLHYKDDSTEGDLDIFFKNEDLRQSLHVGNLPFARKTPFVAVRLEADLMKSVAPWLKVLVENYSVLIYNGQLDIVCAYPLTVNYLKKLDWSGAEEYNSAPRDKWYVNGELAGYVKRAKNLTEVLVRNAGHMVPQDQPIWALALLQNFIFNKPF